MSSELAPFPQRELTAAELDSYRELLGLPNPSRKQRMEVLGCAQPTLEKNSRMLLLMKATMINSIQQLGAKQETGRRMFINGAVVFASVYLYVNNAVEIPFDPQAMQQIEQQDSMELLFEGPSVLSKEASKFCDLLEEVTPILGGDIQHQQLAFIGASTVHMAIMRSTPATPTFSDQLPESLQAYTLDPGLLDLEAMFRRELG